MKYYYKFRFEYPKCFFLSLTIGIFYLCLTGFLAIPSTSLMTAIGVPHLQKRISALGLSTKWITRSFFHTGQDVSLFPTVVYGNIKGIDENGRVKVTMVDGARFVNTSLIIADIRVTDIIKANELVESFKLEDVKVDLYPEEHAVIWIKQDPLNIFLIEAGVAVPDPNPPTNIVDIAFAAHYWRVFKGN